MVGRKMELEALQKAFESKKPELVAVLGRRRIGKTFLIRTFFLGKMGFELVGLQNGSTKQQLRNFAYSMKDAKRSDTLETPPADWLEAFHQLKTYLESLGEPARKKVVFMDEVPWMAAKKSDFITGFSYFWNSYASKSNVVVVMCGSATSWMYQKILNNRGGLHNRVSVRLHLRPFTLSETEAYFLERGIHFDRYQILLLYMALGGIPHYLDQVKGGNTAVQNIDEICFHPSGSLRDEFNNLYTSLFSNPQRYEVVVTALSSTWKGLSREEILTATKSKDGGGLTAILRELELSGFLSSYVPFGKKKKDTLYRLTDYYSLFYLKFIKELPANEPGKWDLVSKTQSWVSWSGYAFENVCIQHIDQIKKALGISGIHTRQYSFLAKGDHENDGAQIDLLIDRSDNAISLCEMKFYNNDVELSKETAEKLRRRMGVFRRASGTKKQVFLVLVTTFGLAQNRHSTGLVDKVVLMDDLF